MHATDVPVVHTMRHGCVQHVLEPKWKPTNEIGVHPKLVPASFQDQKRGTQSATPLGRYTTTAEKNRRQQTRSPINRVANIPTRPLADDIAHTTL